MRKKEKTVKVNCDYKSILISDHDKSIAIFNIPPELYKDIHIICTRDKMSLADFVLSALDMAATFCKETNPKGK